MNLDFLDDNAMTQGEDSGTVHRRKVAGVATAVEKEEVVTEEKKKKGEDDTTFFPELLLPGLFSNLYLLYTLSHLPYTLIPNLCRCFIAVNAFRCAFPNRFNGNVVLHDSPLSSIFLTRLLATASELSLWYLLAHLIDTYSPSPLIITMGWTMPVLCVLAQCFVWSSLLLQTDALMLWEESLWALMFLLNTLFNFTLLTEGVTSPLVTISLLFGAFYLPWQLLGHVPYILALEDPPLAPGQLSLANAGVGLRRALFYRRSSRSLKDWGGVVGVTWMFGYWWAESCWPAAIAWALEAEGRI